MMAPWPPTGRIDARSFCILLNVAQGCRRVFARSIWRTPLRARLSHRGFAGRATPANVAVMRLALYEPDIPQNTGTILRLAACLGVAVDVIGPTGFDMTDRTLRRAGL